MSENSRDEEELQALLTGKSVLSRSYRESSKEQPPAKVDAAVLAAARWAVGADLPPSGERTTVLQHVIPPRRRKSYLDWGVPLAAAAVVVVAVALTFTIERDPAVTEIYEKYDRDVLATLGIDHEPDRGEEISRQSESVAPEPFSSPTSSGSPQVSEPAKVVDAQKAVVAPKEIAPPKLPVAKSVPVPKSAMVAPQPRANEDAALKKKLLEQREIAERKRRQQPDSIAGARSDMEAGKDDKGSTASLLADQPFSGVVAENMAAAEADAETESDRLVTPIDLKEEDGKEVAEQETVGLASGNSAATSDIAARQVLAGPSLGDEQTTSGELAREDSQDTSSEAVRDPDDWIQDMEKLLSDGQRDEALKSLRQFRAEYPDYSLPERLRSLESTESE